MYRFKQVTIPQSFAFIFYVLQTDLNSNKLFQKAIRLSTSHISTKTFLILLLQSLCFLRNGYGLLKKFYNRR